jgi:hypothetical protein
VRVGTDLAYGQDVINVQALEQGPHGEVDIDQTTTKVKTPWKAGDNLQTGVAGFILGTSIELDEIACTRSRVSEDLRDLESVGLDVLRETGPGQREIVPHEIIDRMTRDQG